LRPENEARFLASLRAAIGAGLRGLLLREPGLSDRAYLQLGQSVRQLAPELWLGVHDRVHLAGAIGAEGVHLGFRSLPPAAVSEHHDPRLAIGLSTHAGDECAQWAAADYLFHSPVFATPSKPKDAPGFLEPLGIEGLAEAVKATSQPIWALGGLGPEHVMSCRRAGAAGVAVLSGILGSADPAAATALYLKSFQSELSPGGPSIG
jgi:thiamine-phosphate pyrophosphorylase